MGKIKFSVLMSIYKNEKPEYLVQALDSIFQQTLQADEIVIVKDGLLTPALDKVLDEYKAKYPIIKFLEFEKNRGLGLALRDGVKACSYEWIARMDTDDVAKPDRFAKQIEYIEKHPEIALLGTCIEEFSTDVNRIDSKTFLPLNHEEIVSFSKKRNPFRHMTMFLNKTAILESGNYRHFLWFEDYDLWIRMLYKGYKAANLSEILMSVRADKNMFERRGGWEYFQQDIKFQKFMKKIHMINNIEFCKNLIIRGCIRLVPNSIRTKIYQIFLRE